MSLYLPGPAYFRSLHLRLRIFLFLGGAGILLLIGRLWYLQVVRYPYFVRQAEAQVIRSYPLLPPRGEILDRHHELIVGNQPNLRLRVYPERMTSPAHTARFLREILAAPPANLEDLLKKARRTRPFRPHTVLETLERDDLARFMARAHEHPELLVEMVPVRWFPHGVLASHLLGHLGEVEDEEIRRYQSLRLYTPGDLVGKNGIEAMYEPWLFGTKGREDVRVDAYGRTREVIHRIPAIPGWDLVLTLDLKTQRKAEEALGDRHGSVVALDPRTGEILALVSHPNFDPELFLKPVTEGVWKALFADPNHPFVFRALAGQYPPGSTLKPMIALAALAEGVVRPQESLPCPGYYRLGKKVFRCWKKGGHGFVNLHRALVESCDVFFYEVARRLTIERMKRYASLFGLGARTGIDLGEEKAGLFPDPEWKLKLFREPWQVGETVIAGIGQGYVLVTPLQLAQAYAILANGGYRVQPHLFSGFLHTERPAPSFTLPDFVSAPVGIPPRALALVREALLGVVSEPGGTGVYARLQGIKVAGKTGTAQVVSLEKGEKSDDPRHEDHAWFVAFAPFENPRIVVAVLVEHGGHGGAAAAPIAREVIETYLLETSPPQG